MKQSHREMSKALTAYMSSFEAEKPKPGYLSLCQWGSIMGVCARQALNVIVRLEKAGKVDILKFRTVCRSVIRPRQYYRIAPEALKALGLTLPKR